MKKEKQERILTSPLDDLISERYGEYAKYIIQDRALPDARDGLKPVQRRILYAMFKDGNTADKAFRKSAKTVGLVIGNYHPHGDSSVYEAMVHLSQNWKINYPLVTMHGNNGSIDDDPAAAMRYTEARLAAISEELLEDIDKNTVNWAPNFDDTENEPTVLPAGYPNLLVNGSSGIASGYATNIPPHNLAEVIDGTIYRINNPDCTLEEIMNFIKGPDFPTGGIVMGLEGIRDAFSTGKGKIVVRGKATIEKTKTCQQIVITEIPYEVVKVNMVKKIDEIRFNKDIDGILDVRDESGRNGLRVVVDVNKNSDAEMILNYLYKNTELQVNYNYNMIAIVNRRPMLLGLLGALDAFIEFRKEVVLRRSQYEFAKRIDRCHILEGLIKAVSVLDEVIKIIRNSKDKGDAKRNLIARFEFSDAQAEAIVNLRLYRLTNTDIVELRSEYARLVEELKHLRDIINDPAVLNRQLCIELEEIRKAHQKDRMSVIEHEIADIVIDKTAMITAEDIMISVSRDCYIKRVSLRSYNSSGSPTPGLKSGDTLIGYCQANTLDSMLIFMESGDYAYLPLYVLKEDKWKDIGTHLSNYIKINNSEKIVSCALVSQFHTNAFVISLSDNGMIKKTPVEQWQLQRFSRASTAMVIGENDKVISTVIGYDGDEVMVVSRDGYCVRYPVDLIPSTATKAKGVIAIRTSGDDKAAAMALIRKGDSDAVFLTEAGGGKRIKLSDVQITNRATKGLLIAKKNKTNPAVIRYCYSMSLNDSLNLALEGELLDLKCKDVSLLSADSRFSNPIVQGNWSRIEQIQQVKVVDFPPEEENKMSFEEFTLEV